MTPRPPKLVEVADAGVAWPADRQASPGRSARGVLASAPARGVARGEAMVLAAAPELVPAESSSPDRAVARRTGGARRRGSRRRFGTEGLAQDLRHAVRSLRATPTFTIVALVVLTLGIGATTRSSPWWTEWRCAATVSTRPTARPRDRAAAERPGSDDRRATGFREWRREQTTFEDLAASQGSRDFVCATTARTRRFALARHGEPVSVLRTSPAIGRIFRPRMKSPATSVWSS